MSNLRVKLFAGATPQELEAQVNAWLSKEDVKLEGFDFIADGLDLPYNVMMLYQTDEGR